MTCPMFHTFKLRCCSVRVGQELGSDILFGRRLGFSGTPSNLLPVDLVPCHFEQGSEGKILRALTDESVTN